jgi:hypothetical protein
MMRAMMIPCVVKQMPFFEEGLLFGAGKRRAAICPSPHRRSQTSASNKTSQAMDDDSWDYSGPHVWNGLRADVMTREATRKSTSSITSSVFDFVLFLHPPSIYFHPLLLYYHQSPPTATCINIMSSNDGANKKAKTGLSKTETVHFDPTSIGLPAGWSLTSFSDLKG